MLQQESCCQDWILLNLVPHSFHVEGSKRSLEMSLPQTSVWHHTLVISQGDHGSLWNPGNSPQSTLGFLPFKRILRDYCCSLFSKSEPLAQTVMRFGCMIAHKILGNVFKGTCTQTFRLLWQIIMNLTCESDDPRSRQTDGSQPGSSHSGHAATSSVTAVDTENSLTLTGFWWATQSASCSRG